MKADLSERQINYFLTTIDKSDLVKYLDEKKVRDSLIKMEFYRLINEMGNMEAYAKLANDFNLSKIAIIKIVSDKL